MPWATQGVFNKFDFCNLGQELCSDEDKELAVIFSCFNIQSTTIFKNAAKAPPTQDLPTKVNALPFAKILCYSSSLQPPLLTLHTDRILIIATEEISPIIELISTFLNTKQKIRYQIPSETLNLRSQTHHTTETLRMPLSTQSLQNHIGDRPSAFLAFVGEAIRMAVDTPGIALLLNERSGGIERL